MKKISKILVATLSLILLIGILSACANDTDGDTAATTDDGDAQVELNLMGWQPHLGLLNDEMIPALNELYPHITLNVQILDWFAYWEKLTIDTAAGQAPDIAVLDVAHLPTFFDFYRPLEDLASEVIGPDWKSYFNEGVLDSLKIVDDSIRMIPSDLTGLWFLFYNKSICDELGIDVPSGNYNELVAWIEQANAASGDFLPMAFAGKEDVNVGFFWLWLASNNEYGVVEAAVEGRASFTDEPFVRAFEQILEMMDNGFLDERVFGLDAFPGADTLFRERNAISYLTGQWSTGGYLMGTALGGTATENDELGVVVLQNIEGGQTVMQKYVSQGYSISNDCAHPEDAMRVIEQWTIREGAQMWINYQACVPAANTVELDFGLFKTEEARRTAGPALAMLVDNPGVQRSTLNSALDMRIGELVVSVLRMGMDPEEALERMQQAVIDLSD